MRFPYHHITPPLVDPSLNPFLVSKLYWVLNTPFTSLKIDIVSQKMGMVKFGKSSSNPHGIKVPCGQNTISSCFYYRVFLKCEMPKTIGFNTKSWSKFRWFGVPAFWETSVWLKNIFIFSVTWEIPLTSHSSYLNHHKIAINHHGLGSPMTPLLATPVARSPVTALKGLGSATAHAAGDAAGRATRWSGLVVYSYHYLVAHPTARKRVITPVIYMG